VAVGGKKMRYASKILVIKPEVKRLPEDQDTDGKLI
jgi:hypothetical protein